MITLTYADLIQRIRPYFTTAILSRGWEYYRESAVGRIKTEGESIVTAIVDGSEDYAVRLDIHSFPKSRCTCPYSGYCKHMAAVLFEISGRAGLEPRQLLKPDRQLSLVKPSKPSSQEVPTAIVRQETTKAAAPGASTEAVIVKKRVTVPKESGTAEDWHRYFEKQLEKYPAYSMHSIEHYLPTITKSLLPYGQAWKPALKHLYELQVLLFTMKRADELQAQISRSYPYYAHQYADYFRTIANSCQERLVQLIRNLNVDEARQLYPGLLQETAAYLNNHAFPEHSSAMRWSAAYGILWWNLLRNPAWVEAERSRIEAAIAERRISPGKKDALLASALLFDVMDGHDQRAMNRASQELADKQPGLFFPFVQTLCTSEEWERMILWLHWLRPMVKTSGPAWIEPYLHYWQEVGKHRELDKEWQETVNFLLPASYPYYSQFLIKQQRYREWADLNLLFYKSPLDIHADILKLVEAQDIRFVLPLYHFAIERAILEKNRVSYKVAVKLLKKLFVLYKRLNEQERWEQYILHISIQFHRYRAFQEELRKGKLIV